MNSVDKEILEALKYIYENVNGYVHDLIANIGEERMEQFRVVGFIHLGYTLMYKTWSITDLGKQYYREIR